MEIKTIGIIGAGTMGSGIAQVSVQRGYKVLLRDLEKGILEKALDRISKGLAKGVEKGKFSEADKGAMLSAITTTTDLALLKIVTSL